ncbi:MAG: palindromic element RPE4 domain-containing protein [Rickettsia endosymbiont of Ecitomorpha arachnoides]|nr:palindromic element RPE4 domain-containing protein [Rickettsia endosymbiont of Sceptobius lativentris]MCC8461794.1 palindromic element RPE4 domain-containing protein [Rickettsia endosymbiont of Ecitomorpha arachnoides]HJD58360.1 palindromic element RPE4 domain-containing protein [Rickettsia endosymbiont of Ceroptres masudai]
MLNCCLDPVVKPRDDTLIHSLCYTVKDSI